LIAVFGVAGMLGRPHESDTAILLAESAASTGLWTAAIKEISGRARPRETLERDGDWNGPGGVFAEDPVGGHGLQSFPSGHTSGTWAVATVLARQYPQHHIVPVVAFGGALVMSYARMAVNAHWFSDVVVGGLVGYGCARQTIESREERGDEMGGNSHALHVYLDMENGHRGVGLSYRL
jgi:membrane-associated phospholipid phosphatase